MFLKNVFSKICGPYKFIFTFTNIYILKRMPLFILAVLPGNWIVHCTFLSSLVYIQLIFVQFSLFLYSSVCKSVWKSHPYENSLMPTLVWILYATNLEGGGGKGLSGPTTKKITFFAAFLSDHYHSFWRQKHLVLKHHCLRDFLCASYAEQNGMTLVVSCDYAPRPTIHSWYPS